MSTAPNPLPAPGGELSGTLLSLRAAALGVARQRLTALLRREARPSPARATGRRSAARVLLLGLALALGLVVAGGYWAQSAPAPHYAAAFRGPI